MKSGKRVLIAALIALLSTLNVYAKTTEPAKSSAPTTDAKEIMWDELMPPPDQKVIDRYQAGKMERAEVMAYLDKLGVTPVDQMDKQYVRIPGYLVPLNMDKNQKATELLLVPTMGACVHTPPPPPNQTIFVRYEKGIEVTEAGYTPYWLVGTISVERNDSQYTETLYAMKVESVEEYK